MMVTTTPSVSGQRLTRQHRIVTGEAIRCANLLREMFVAICGAVGVDPVRCLMNNTLTVHAPATSGVPK